MRGHLLLLCVAVLGPFPAVAHEDAAAHDRYRLGIESDVFAYPTLGYSRHASVRPPNSRWRLGAGVFGTTLRFYPFGSVHVGVEL